MALESAAINKQTLDAMAKGAKAQREATGKMYVLSQSSVVCCLEGLGPPFCLN